ncbi:MAG: glycerol-3-phosphate 1-O-acyltransferase PlsY [Lachnospiraceae bacterium]|nr:glycerol-3-phosphate 1-O-acyltransferase PlsY [Lachnospiraceae bacterium]
MGIEILYRALCLIGGYCFGLFQTAYIIGKMHHIDIREYGSGNSGTTNALRVLGKRVGAAVLLGDVLKCIVACLIARIIFNHLNPDCTILMVIYTGFGVVLGHIFPFYMHFNGGKGVASIAGVIISLLDWRIMVICLLEFAIVVAITRYVSLGSILLMVVLVASYSIFVFVDPEFYHIGGEYRIESIIVLVLLGALSIFMHRKNIGRLLRGKENKLGQKKPVNS